MRFLTYTRRTETRSCIAVCCRNALPICDIKGIQIVIMWPNLVQPSLRVNARENFSLLFTTRRSTKITLKVIVLEQMLTTLTNAHGVTIVWTTKIKDIKGQLKVSKGRKRTRKQCHSCHGLLIFIKTLFTLNDWYPSSSNNVHLSRKSVW